MMSGSFPMGVELFHSFWVVHRVRVASRSCYSTVMLCLNSLFAFEILSIMIV